MRIKNNGRGVRVISLGFIGSGSDKRSVPDITINPGETKTVPDDLRDHMWRMPAVAGMFSDGTLSLMDGDHPARDPAIVEALKGHKGGIAPQPGEPIPGAKPTDDEIARVRAYLASQEAGRDDDNRKEIAEKSGAKAPPKDEKSGVPPKDNSGLPKPKL